MKKFIALILMIFVSNTVVGAQNTITLDLSKENQGTLTFPIQPGEYTIQVINRLPNGKYEIKIEIEDETIKPFSNDDITPLTTVRLSNEKDNRCNQISTLISRLQESDEEATLSSLRAELESLLNITEDSCPNSNMAKALLASIDYISPKITIKGSKTLIITVKRTNKDGKVLEWIRTCNTPSRGKWVTAYGFNFITQWFGKESVYFSKDIGADQYKITREENRKKIDFAPSVFFTWVPTNNIGKRNVRQNFKFGFSGGLGFDSEKVMVFAAPSIIYNQNLSFHIGIAARQINVLKGKYNDCEIVTESLSIDQLHDAQYRANVFMAISFRFDKNPFKLGKPAED